MSLGGSVRGIVLACLALTGLSLLVAAPAPAYDAWAWLLWGREVAGGSLSTAEGPAFKPLPVALAAVLSIAGPAAPLAFVALQRAGAALAVVLAWRAARRLAGGSHAAGALAAGGVALCGGFAAGAAAGLSEGLLLGLALAAAEAWRSGRPRWALALGVCCALVRVETWPFLLAAAGVAWRRRPQDRPLLAAAAVLVPAAWLVPELLGSGDPLRSGARARVPNPGQPALADVPALASLRAAVALPPWPLWAGVAALAWASARHSDRAARAALAPVGLGLAWIALVAAMAQAGFSGEPRYALPGAALVALGGAAGVGLALPRMRVLHAGVATAVVLVAMAIPVAPELRALPAAQAHQWRLQADLGRAIRAAGGRGAVLGCGAPYVGRLRGPLMAYRLGVAKRRVEPDRPPRPPGVVFRSRRVASARAAPDAPPAFRPVARAGGWEVRSTCPVRVT